MAVLLLFLIIVFSCRYNRVNAELASGCNHKNTSENTTSLSKYCIGKYSELHLWMLNNTELLNQLTETFFPPGKAPSAFVTIDYCVNYPDESNYCAQDIGGCKGYVWSEKELYLQFLCPKAMQWLTFFAIQIPEQLINIELPCLCKKTYAKLLSRLTYQVLLVTYSYLDR